MEKIYKQYYILSRNISSQTMCRKLISSFLKTHDSKRFDMTTCRPNEKKNRKKEERDRSSRRSLLTGLANKAHQTFSTQSLQQSNRCVELLHFEDQLLIVASQIKQEKTYLVERNQRMYNISRPNTRQFLQSSWLLEKKSSVMNQFQVGGGVAGYSNELS